MTIPWRGVTRRTPASLAGIAASSQTRQTSARKPSPARCLLGDGLAAPRAVGADRRHADEDGRRRVHARDRLGERPRRLHAAVEDGLLAARGPDAVERDGRQVDDGVDAFESAVVQRPGRRDPKGSRPVPASLLRTSLITRWPAVVR